MTLSCGGLSAPMASGGPAPGCCITGPWGGGHSCPPAVVLLVAMKQLALGTSRADTPAGEVRAQQYVLLLALGTQRTVAFEEVAADLSLAGHIHMAVGAVAVVANSLQEVGAHRHLILGYIVGEGAGPICLLARAPDKPGAHSNLLRVMNVWAVLAAVTPSKAVVVHTVLLFLLLFLPSLPDDGQAALNSPAG